MTVPWRQLLGKVGRFQTQEDGVPRPRAYFHQLLLLMVAIAVDMATSSTAAHSAADHSRLCVSSWDDRACNR